jgi:hypothetical protein
VEASPALNVWSSALQHLDAKEPSPTDWSIHSSATIVISVQESRLQTPNHFQLHPILRKKPSPQSCGSRKHIHLGFNLGADCKPRVILENQKTAYQTHISHI